MINDLQRWLACKYVITSSVYQFLARSLKTLHASWIRNDSKSVAMKFVNVKHVKQESSNAAFLKMTANDRKQSMDYNAR